MSDLKLQMYIGNILEMLIIVNTISVSISYSSFEQLLYKIDRNNIDVELASAYFICKILTSEGFKFKYKKVKNYYTGYDFSKNIFTNELSQPMIYTLTNKLVKLIHILSINNIDVLEKITLNKVEYSQLLDFLVKVLKEYTGIETKTYKKIQEIECMLESFERKKDNE
ncbi:hypothetical protein IR145_05880 [Streptococcus danieliae]|nr:hypothetical protein [Streptococcus danieliae]TFU60511.1 hypothetical protein E4T67_00855 [Gemella sp. WT2a]